MRDKYSTQKLLVTITLAILLLIGSATAVVAWQTHKEGNTKTTTAQTTQKTTTKPQPATEVSYKGEEGKSALELLKQHATVVTKDSSYGPYVDSINGVGGGTGGKYWTFYVNGAQASVGAGAYVTHKTDQIQWKFE